jgi:uncharacterized membrane protein HdeD (DUF308 family)
MKKFTPSQLFSMLAVPAVTILLGLVLLFTPDTASALIGQLLAWCCLLSAAVLGAGVFFGAPARRSRRIAWTVISAAAGAWMLFNPLTVAKFLGRVLGIALMIRGAQSVADNLHYSGKQLQITRGLVLAAVTLIAGAVLAVLPLASSRLLFNIIGIVLICVGTAQAVDRIRGRKLLDGGDDPNIIDVEKL